MCLPALFEDLTCVNQGLGKSFPIKRFQEIVDSVHFEMHEWREHREP